MRMVFQLPNFPSNWKTFPSQQIPKYFNYGQIHEYLMSSCVFEDDNKENDNESNKIDYSTSKSLKRAQQYFDSGHVIDMEDSVSVTSNIYCFKSLVQTSFKSVKYPVQVIMHRNSGKIILGTCECKASALGRCSHVAALLYALEDFVKKIWKKQHSVYKQAMHVEPGTEK